MNHTHDEGLDEAQEPAGDRPHHGGAASQRQETEDPLFAASGGRRSTGNGAASAQAWLAQLQAIIDNLATQSAPVISEVGAKAAEIAALAADRAGPLAQRAADATQQVSVRVAERSRVLAADLRRGPERAAGGGSGMAGAADSTEWAMTDDTPAEDSHEDTPAS